MLQRGLSRITESESFDTVAGLTHVEAGAPVAAIFNNSKMKLEVSTNNKVNTTLANWKFIGFAFNKYCDPSSDKFHNLELDVLAEDTYGVTVVPANFFDSTTSNKHVYLVAADGSKSALTAVSAKADVDSATEYYPDPVTKQVYVQGASVGLKLFVTYNAVLDPYAAQLENQFGSNIYLSNLEKLNVITKAQTVAIDSKFVNADSYIASGVYNKAPACYLTADATTGEFKITIGGSTGTALNSLTFKGFEGSYAVFELGLQA